MPYICDGCWPLGVGGGPCWLDDFAFCTAALLFRGMSFAAKSANRPINSRRWSRLPQTASSFPIGALGGQWPQLSYDSLGSSQTLLQLISAADLQETIATYYALIYIMLGVPPE